ncbi:hypothetical protein CLTEP_12730 [Clostridium tepidiprofundi DSM 19306]|uniref:DUF8042 domain-containing protein n=1 Tax=Clostridium tepidiprofundi DSM 19306 TaxID=1121338 RepID=A0A151B4H8_9CLOT|nr:hypothetical protein [Clostridium tepidiprofundi]KYH34808.1 hypothetical protein CLTEP_12730 [Clostridium tepidiprofundi DSM 19306]
MSDTFETLNMVRDYIENLINGIQKAVVFFQSGEEKKGAELLVPIIDGIEWINEAIIVTKDVHKGKITLDGMNDMLKEIVEAFQNQDFVLIGDLFEYEIIPAIKEIENEIIEITTYN